MRVRLRGSFDNRGPRKQKSRLRAKSGRALWLSPIPTSLPVESDSLLVLLRSEQRQENSNSTGRQARFLKLVKQYQGRPFRGGLEVFPALHGLLGHAQTLGKLLPRFPEVLSKLAHLLASHGPRAWPQALQKQSEKL